MSSREEIVQQKIQEILSHAKDRGNVLREHIDRGRYDNKKPAVIDKLNDIITDNKNKITNVYKKHYKRVKFANLIPAKMNKPQQDMKKDHVKLYDMINNTFSADLENRDRLITAYRKNNIPETHKCKNMSREKCLRGSDSGGGGTCQWVPGVEEYGQWVGKPCNERKEGQEEGMLLSPR